LAAALQGDRHPEWLSDRQPRRQQNAIASGGGICIWYQYYCATETGLAGYRENLSAFNKLIWKTASPKWNFDDATHDRTAALFNNPDHVALVIHITAGGSA